MVAGAAGPAHGGGGFALLLLDYRQALEALTSGLPVLGARLATGFAMAPAELAAALNRVTAEADPAILITGVIALLVAGQTAQRLVRNRLAGGAPASIRIAELARRVLVELLGLGAFAVVTLGLALAFVPEPGPAQVFVLTYVTAGLCALAAAAAARILFAPEAPEARIVPIDNASARFLYRWLVRIAAFSSFAWLSAALLILSGVRIEVHLVLVLAIGALTAGLAIAMILRGRALVARALPALAGIGRSWHVIAVLYVVAIWALWAESILARRPSAIWAAIGSVVLVAALPIADRLLGFGLAKIADGREADAGVRFTDAIRRAFRLGLGLALVVLIPNLWGLDLLEAFGAPGAEVLSRALFDMSVTALLAFFLWQAVDVALERRFKVADVNSAASEAAARIRTIKPLIRKFVLGVLTVVWVLIALSAIGVDIGPLLAGAGVVGIALGFGAQTLVRDIVSGVFFLWDDAFRVGEYVEAGELRGTVETISLRSLRLRHHRGPVHTIPFGELRSLTNHSRDWVIIKLELLVTYDTDIERVRKLLKQIGMEMQQDPELGPNLLEPLKSQGIHRMADHGLLIRAKFKARPGEHFLIQREAYRRIKQAFDAGGIRFAYPTVTIHATGRDAGDGAPPDLSAAASAAAVLAHPAAGTA